MNNRTTVSRRLRFEILRRDDYTCQYCGGKAPDVKLHVDHVIPVSLGGMNAPTNLVTACVDCNTGKGSISVAEPKAEATPKSTAAFKAAFAEVMAAEAEKVDGKNQHREWFRELCHDHEFDLSKTPGWANTIGIWQGMGIPWELVEDSFEAMLGSSAQKKVKFTEDQQFRYFCGIMWKRIRAASEIAQSKVAQA